MRYENAQKNSSIEIEKFHLSLAKHHEWKFLSHTALGGFYFSSKVLDCDSQISLQQHVIKSATFSVLGANKIYETSYTTSAWIIKAVLMCKITSLNEKAKKTCDKSIALGFK